MLGINHRRRAAGLAGKFHHSSNSSQDRPIPGRARSRAGRSTAKVPRLRAGLPRALQTPLGRTSFRRRAAAKAL
jgi:hypothetical protein